MPSGRVTEPTMDDLRKQIAELLSEADDIAKQAQEEERITTAEEQEQIRALQDEAETLSVEYRRRIQAQDISNHVSRSQGIRDLVNQLPVPQERIIRGTQPGRLTRVRDLWMDDPKKGYSSHREFLLDVMRAATQGRESVQLQYLKIRATAGSDEHSTFNDPYGGYLVPVGFSPTMLQVMPEDDPTMGRVTPVPMDTPMLGIAARVDKDHSSSVTGGLIVYRRAEAETVTASRMQMEMITLRANPLMGISYATEELLTDSPQSFVAILSAGFRDEFDSRILRERLNGSGVGEFLGVLQSPALISVTRQVANEISYEDVLNMMSRCWGYRNAVWIGNHDTIPQLGQLNLTVGAGGSAIFVQNATADFPAMLMGKPLFFSEYVQTLGTAGDLLLVNWTQYLEGLYQPLQSAESIHVRFVNNERSFRFTMRNDAAPWWRSALTPANSTTTLSPYVTLAA